MTCAPTNETADATPNVAPSTTSLNLRSRIRKSGPAIITAVPASGTATPRRMSSRRWLPPKRAPGPAMTVVASPKTAPQTAPHTIVEAIPVSGVSS